MVERHTVDFDQVAFNVLTDHERRLITLQFDRTADEWGWTYLHSESRDPCFVWRRGLARLIGKHVRRRFGDGLARRLARRLLRRAPSPLVPARRFRPHADNPDVVCWDLSIRDGARPEDALAALLDVLRETPGYRRTHGPPLDRDEVPDPSASRRRVVEFDREAVEVLTDPGRRVVTIRFRRDRDWSLRRALRGEFARARWFTMRLELRIHRRFGPAPFDWFARPPQSGGPSPLTPELRFRPHPAISDVTCWDLRVRDGASLDEAFAALLDALREIPGCRRTSDPDDEPRPVPLEAGRDASGAADAVLRAAWKG